MPTIATRRSAIAYRQVRRPRGCDGSHSRQFVVVRSVSAPIGRRARRATPADRCHLPGHGASDDNPAAYSLRGYARSVRAVVDALGVADAHILGWSLGGHVALELAPDMPQARGFIILGTPPLAFPPAMEQAFLPNPAMAFSFAEHLDRDQAAAYAAAGFRPGATHIPPSFIEDILRTDGRARAGLAASIAPNAYHDEVEVVANMKAPLAVLHGAPGATGEWRLFRVAEDADALARRRADHPWRRTHAALGDSPSVRRAARRFPDGNDLKQPGGRDLTLLERLNAHPMPFAEWLGIEYLSADLDAVRARLVVRHELCTLNSFVHGGAIMSFADTLGGAAAFLNLPEGAKGTTTLESKTNFISGAPVNTILVGTCTPIHRGRRTQVWQTLVETEDGVRVALVLQTQMTL